MRTSVLLTIVRYFRHGSSDVSAPTGFNSKLRPATEGAQRFWVAPHALLPAAPCTDSMQTNRVLSAAAATAAPAPNRPNAGSIASRYGRATVAPRLLRKVRRGIAVRVRKCMSASWLALNERGRRIGAILQAAQW